MVDELCKELQTIVWLCGTHAGPGDQAGHAPTDPQLICAGYQQTVNMPQTGLLTAIVLLTATRPKYNRYYRVVQLITDTTANR